MRPRRHRLSRGTQSRGTRERLGETVPVRFGKSLSQGCRLFRPALNMNIVFALAGVVIKEMYRRKDFYVLFVLTALLTLMTGSATFFNDDKIVGYLKEICLLLIWVSSLVIVLTTAARQI